MLWAIRDRGAQDRPGKPRNALYAYKVSGGRVGEVDGAAFTAVPVPVPTRDAEDIGRSAYGIFKAGPAMIGKTIGIAGEHLSGAEMASALATALGREVRHAAVTPAQYRAFGFPGADDLGNMFQYKRDFEADFRAPRDVEATRRLNPRLQSFAQWLQANASRMPVG